MQNRRGTRPELRVAVVAAESSGDLLGAGLLEALSARVPTAEFVGMAGDLMISAGCDPWHRIEEVSVMGLTEVLPHLPRLLRLRRHLIGRIADYRPDVFIGIDSPAFNLPIAAALKAAGIPVVQYVSPQVWAWRQSRVSGIRNGTDLVLCVLPFELEFLRRNGVTAEFVGHPLADSIAPDTDSRAMRAAIGAHSDGPLLAMLPGSRRGEVARLARPFLETAAWLSERRPALQFAVALANSQVGEVFGAIERTMRRRLEPLLITGRSRQVIAASDAVLTASGTATLETLLLQRRMVVAHKISPLTFWLVRRMGVARLPNFSLPNLLAGRRIVPEFAQAQVRAEVLGPCLLEILDGGGLDPQWQSTYRAIGTSLRRGASSGAADAVLELLAKRRAAA